MIQDFEFAPSERFGAKIQIVGKSKLKFYVKRKCVSSGKPYPHVCSKAFPLLDNFDKLERNFQHWLATNKTLGNGISRKNAFEIYWPLLPAKPADVN